jgi:hypothetical protein
VSNLQSRRFNGCLLAIAFVFLASCVRHDSAQQPVTEKVDFEGPWNGEYKDNENQTGKGKYLFHKEKEDRWEVTVSWVDKKGDTQSMQVKGERLGPDAVRLQGRDGDITYWYVGRMETKDGPFVLHYVSVNAKTGKSGSGVSTLTRAN